MIYLASPYEGHACSKTCAYADAMHATRELMTVGVDVFSPVVYFHPLSLGMNPKPHSFWMDRCLEMLERCDELVCVRMPGWWDSNGIRQEVETAIDEQMPITDLAWPLDKHEVAKVAARSIPSAGARYRGPRADRRRLEARAGPQLQSRRS